MNREANIRRFEELMARVKRNGIDSLMNYIRKSDFYTAPASSRFHLSCEGGLLQHSLNVYDCLCDQLYMKDLKGDGIFQIVAPEAETKVVPVAEIKEETIIITSLLHDICKTNFYTVDYRNQKVYKPDGSKRDAGGAFDWERVPFYAICDKNPYGHGEKSVMMVEEFMKLTMEERYAIRWHMGMAELSHNEIMNFNASVDKYPLVLLLHTADQMAAHFVEQENGNKQSFNAASQDPGDEEHGFEEARPI